MPNPHNNLDTVLKYRSHLVEEVQRELVELKQRFSIEENQLLQLDQKRRNVINDIAERQKSGIDAQEMSLSHQFIKLQGDRIKDQKKKVQTLSGECETHRVRLEHLLQEKKIVENIKNKRQKIQADRLKKNEKAILDEVSGRRERSIQ